MPANDPAIDLEVERLMGRVRGVVKVQVIKAKGLKSYDTLTGGARREAGEGGVPGFIRAGAPRINPDPSDARCWQRYWAGRGPRKHLHSL
jgi:hypothetical protein